MVGIDLQRQLPHTRQTTKSTTYTRYMRLYLKHETTSVMDPSGYLFRIMSLPLLPCSLAQSLLVHPETGTKQCPDRFQHDKHATKTIYSVWPPLHFALIAIHVEDRHRPLPKITSNARRQQATNNDAFCGRNRARPGLVLCTPDRGRSCQWILVRFMPVCASDGLDDDGDPRRATR